MKAAENFFPLPLETLELLTLEEVGRLTMALARYARYGAEDDLSDNRALLMLFTTAKQGVRPCSALSEKSDLSEKRRQAAMRRWDKRADGEDSYNDKGMEEDAETAGNDTPDDNGGDAKPMQNMQIMQNMQNMQNENLHDLHDLHADGKEETPPTPPKEENNIIIDPKGSHSSSDEDEAMAITARVREGLGEEGEENAPSPEPDTAEAGSGADTAAPGLDALKDFFNRSMEGKAIPRVVCIRGERRARANARIREYGMESVYAMITKAAESPFLNGAGEKPFVASFDWLMRPNNFPKVLEGNYDPVPDPPPREAYRPPRSPSIPAPMSADERRRAEREEAFGRLLDGGDDGFMDRVNSWREENMEKTKTEET